MPGSLPEGWCETALGDVAEVIAGQSPPGTTVSDWDGSSTGPGLPFIQGNAEFGARSPSPTKWCIAPAKRAEPGDTLLSVRAPVGETNRADGPLAIGRGIAAVRFRDIEPEFGWHALNHAKRAFERLAQGSTFEAIGAEVIKGLTLRIPPLAEQRGIAAVLDTVDDTIERTEAVIAATEELRRALLHELLTRGVPGLHSEWKHVPGLGTVPMCWEVATLGEVCERPEYGAGAPAIAYDPRLPRYVRITDLTDDGRLRADEPRSADPVETAGFELQPGDLLFARSGATVGKTYLYREEDGPCVYAGYLIRFRAKSESVNPDFLELWTRGGLYERWVASMFRAGAQPNINATEYASLPLAVPNPSEQGQIVEVLAAIRERLDASRRALTRLAQAKAGLSDALLSGRIRPAAPAEVSA